MTSTYCLTVLYCNTLCEDCVVLGAEAPTGLLPSMGSRSPQTLPFYHFTYTARITIMHLLRQKSLTFKPLSLDSNFVSAADWVDVGDGA